MRLTADVPVAEAEEGELTGDEVQGSPGGREVELVDRTRATDDGDDPVGVMSGQQPAEHGVVDERGGPAVRTPIMYQRSGR